MYNNIIFWGATGPLKLDQCSNWTSKEFLDLHWIFLEINKYLLDYQITNYKIIITEHSNTNLLDKLSLFVEANIIIVQTDHLHHNSLLRCINYISDKEYTIPYLISDTMVNLVDAANKYIDKNIIFYSVVANLTRETDQLVIPKNLIIRYTNGGNLFWNTGLFKNSPVVLSKTTDAVAFVCLNNNNRPHRTALVAYLLADNLDQHGYISCISWHNDPTAGCFLDWCFDSTVHDQIAIKIKNGIATFNNSKLIQLEWPVTGTYVDNYNQKLYPLYQTTFIDIISDTTFFEPSAFINDKYVNAILGANFPIFISSSGTVEQLRQLGFDVFDDVIDHSYDTISDHAVRLSQAIELNKHLLVNVELTSQLWHTHANRFKQNQHYFFNEFKQVIERIMTNEFESGVVELANRI